MTKSLCLSWALAFLVSCSPGPLLKPFGMGPDEHVEPYACPASFVPDFVVLNLSSSQVIPAKVAVSVDGELKYDECQAQPVLMTVPQVRARRSETSQNDVQISARFFKDGILPTSLSLEIQDRGDCTGAPSLFFAQAGIALEFHSQPYDKDHSECGSFNSAEVNLKN